MHRLFLLLLVFLSATTAGGCDRQCGGTSVPYPFGFSSDCPILLSCNASASTALLPNSTTAYPITSGSFNSTSSTFPITVAASCNRSVSEARASLAGTSYGVSSHTGLFLRGGCRTPAPNESSASCSVPDDVLSGLLQTAQCYANDTTWTCVSTAPPATNSAAAARGEGQFVEWKKVDEAGCEEALTWLVYATTPEGVPSVEFGVGELGWWLDGRCNSTAAANATAARCAQNATCHDVETPSGAWGHRCACMDGMSGDGFAAGEACHHDVAGECLCFP